MFFIPNNILTFRLAGNMQAQRQEAAQADPNLGQATYRSIEVYFISFLYNCFHCLVFFLGFLRQDSMCRILKNSKKQDYTPLVLFCRLVVVIWSPSKACLMQKWKRYE